jgi:hypothetical protein
MFRKLNKPQLNKIKQQNFVGIRAFNSRLYLDISRSFKWKGSLIFRYFEIFQVSQMFTCGLSDLLFLAVGSLVVFVLREYILKVHVLVSSEHKLCQIWNTCIVSCIYWSIAFLSKIVDIFFSKAYYQKSYRYILIIENSSVVTVAEWLDGKFWKPKKPAVVQYPKVPKYVYHVFKPKTVKGLSSFIQEQKNKL